MHSTVNVRWMVLGLTVCFLMAKSIGDAKPVDVWDQLTAESGKMFYKMLEYLSDYDDFDDSDKTYQKREGSSVPLQTSNRVDSGAKNNSEKCKLPPRRGLCRALLPRWRYDMDSKSCHEFTFGGCDGNANNFMTYEKCMDTCRGV
ncbi:kunitz-type serine protease inhibitor Hg1-like [Uranotaenia lowii]|uniref:kunitz-type serine protease inhibitor Hg1-like n=1 Tax=Uranotaenia lowii TaxID=190385 RepID=UPI0024786AB6|nr:kunitz-type serine protease inhibitor Hg1-like [Uranotaenia lowii]